MRYRLRLTEKEVENGAWLPGYGASAGNGRIMRLCRLRLPGNVGNSWRNAMESRFVLGTVLAVAVAVVPVAAHHSFAAEYDQNKPISVTGEVVRLDWTNPHARVAVDQKTDDGKTVHWDFELGPPTALMRRGWSRNSLKPGTVVTVNGFLAKDEPNVANARTVTLADGRQVFAGSSFDTNSPAQTATP